MGKEMTEGEGEKRRVGRGNGVIGRGRREEKRKGICGKE